MDFKRFLWRLMVFIFILGTISGIAGANLTVTLPKVTTQDLIDLFWSGDANTADLAGRTISADPTAAIDDKTPGKPDVKPPSAVYIFWSGAGLPSEVSTGLRLWDNTKNILGSHYTALQTWGNPAAAPATAIFTNAFAYIAAEAAKPVITQYSETGTSVLSPAKSFSKSVTFTSVQPLNGVYQVELKRVTWNLDGKDLQPSGATLNLSTQAYKMDPGTSYTVKVKHQSYWGAYSAYSDPVTYTVGVAGAAGGGAVTINLKAPANGTGINSFSVASAAYTAFDACKAFNDKYAAPLVRTFGYWDPNLQAAQGVIVDYAGNDISAAAKAALKSIKLVPGEGYQVYINDGGKAVDIQVTL